MSFGESEALLTDAARAAYRLQRRGGQRLTTGWGTPNFGELGTLRPDPDDEFSDDP